VIYYLSKILSSPELQYSHVENLALAAIIIVQRFRHYIFLCTTIVIEDSNPMYHIITHQVLGDKYSKWIVILQEFDLEFVKSKAKKYLVFATFPMLMKILSPEILSLMRICSSSSRLTLGMEISFFISRPNILIPISLVKSVVVSAIILIATLSSMTLCITIVLKLSYDDV
jgi:hypothetical protein